MNEPKRVVILQGPQGSGKTTFTKKAYPEALVCSADTFFVGPDGTYKHEMSKLKDAHAWCLRRFVEALRTGDEPVLVVDNTHSQKWEMSPYVALAKAYGYEVEIHTFLIDPRVAFERNVHNTPWDTILRTTMFMEAPLATWGRHTVHLPNGDSWSNKLDDPPPVDNG